ncbi:MAG: energy-coupling factor transporter transmembrane component T [Nanoarchaeota archaeon]
MFAFDPQARFKNIPFLLRFLCFAALISLAFALQGWQAMLILLGTLLLLALLNRTPVLTLARLFLGMLPFLLISVLSLALIFVKDSGVDFIVGFLARILCVILSALLFTQSTDLLELYIFLRSLRLPRTLALAVYLMLRFLPEVENDLLEVRDMQKSRGITLSHPVAFAKSLLIPLVMLVVVRSQEMAIAHFLKNDAFK